MGFFDKALKTVQSIAKKKVDNFEEIRRVEQQFDMGIITKEEKEAKIEALTK